MNKIKLTIAYDGTNFAGFQIQSNARTVQGVLNKALDKTHGTSQKTIASGRTDAGVHAHGQVVHYSLQGNTMPISKLSQVINNQLPSSIRVLRASKVSENFHARYHARVRHYRYRILPVNEYACMPKIALYCYELFGALDMASLADHLKEFQGHHDFTSFAALNDSSLVKEREIFSIQVWRQGLELICDFWGNAFLQNQIRAMLGTALFASRKQKKLGYVSRLLSERNPRLAKARVPSCGLTLIGVYYTPIFGWRDYYKNR